MRRRALRIALIAIALTGLDVRADGDAHPSLVPWKVVEPGAPSERAPLTLYWIPASRDEVRRSDLLTSDELTLYSSQCVAMRIVRHDDRQTLDRLAVAEELPVAVLVTADERIVGRAGVPLTVTAAESMVRHELDQRAAAAESMLDQAAEKVDEGEMEAAVQLYGEVWAQRCLCPRQAKAAYRALRRLRK